MHVQTCTCVQACASSLSTVAVKLPFHACRLLLIRSWGDPGLLTWAPCADKATICRAGLGDGLSWAELDETPGACWSSRVTDLTRNNLGSLRSAWERVLTVSS